ncbi:MAG: hypothetical protein IJX90_11130 [Blautia sp.]|nr:hypothetical protein [Blautia sp.]
MKTHKRILSISAGLSLLILLFVGNLLGILTDKQEDAKEYYMEAGTVGIDLAVDTGSDEAILIEPNQTTPLSIQVTNTGSKDCYVFVKLIIPDISGQPILSISPTGNWQKVDTEGLVYQYIKNGEAGAIESGETTAEMVAEAKFYDFDELVDFSGEVQVIAYAVQTDGFSSEASASDIWSTTVTAVGD